MEKEEALKISLTDNVEARINAWKNGKDNNIRALLSSLDTILWKESNWVSINLSELITPQQVKIKYMKAVAKVHPDKLKPDTSVEQRMIANNVFGVLNKAWDSFKQANGL
ncbi:DnaJ domain-containing protein [Chytridium lagenaria]|nr:DnaJ domain-containing protein [Chytridium lagenaria]